jgi:hypothetical protein
MPHAAHLSNYEFTQAVEQLLAHDRPVVALRAIAFSRGDAVPTEVAITTLRRLANTDEFVSQHNMNDTYLVSRVLNRIRSDESIDLNRVADIEENFIQSLADVDYVPVTYDLLASNPDRFVNALCLAYRADNAAPDEREQEISATEKQQALAAWHLLFHWKRLPGQRADGSVDGEHLRRWVAAVKAGGIAKGRKSIVLSRIGQTLAQGSGNPDLRDAAWPSREVRAELERHTEKGIADGFLTACFNRRGGVMKAIYEGGAQERALASKYLAWSEICATSHSVRTARLLARIARAYNSEAEDADRRAQIDKRRAG